MTTEELAASSARFESVQGQNNYLAGLFTNDLDSGGPESQGQDQEPTTILTVTPVHPNVTVVYIPVLKMCKATCKLEELKWHDPLSPTTRQAIENQQTLGGEFLLQGYLTIDWPAAIQENHPDMPKLLRTYLYIGLWKTLFTSIWEQWNTIAHSNESIVVRIERDQLIVELKEWK